MGTEYWVLSIIAIVLALVAGFIGGRMSAPRQRQIEAMEQERDAARAEAEAVRSEVNRHFEESARMFGKLASDYRTFFQQFARTAQNLGLSEGRARELLEEADPNLVAGRVDSAGHAEAATEDAPAEPNQARSSGSVSGAGADTPRTEGSPAGTPDTDEASRHDGVDEPTADTAARDQRYDAAGQGEAPDRTAY